MQNKYNKKATHSFTPRPRCNKNFENSIVSAWVGALQKLTWMQTSWTYKSKVFWVCHFFSVVTGKQIFDILLLNNLFMSFDNLYISLRFYATFKVRKFESLFYKINTCLQKATTCIWLWAEEIFSVNIKCILNFGSYFWLFVILALLASATKFAHWISAELFNLQYAAN